MARRQGDPRTRQLRLRVAQEAARLLAEHGGDDVAWARRKAASKLGLRDETMLPGGEEILAALREHRGLFGGPAPGAGLRRRREAALVAMEFFAALEPRLVGATLVGDATDAPVRLHLHADDPDAVARLLLERGVPARQDSRPVRLERDRREDLPAWSFEADGVAFELVQLPMTALRHPPRDLLDDRPLERGSIATVRRLLDDDPTR
jgi:hypothetical protein